MNDYLREHTAVKTEDYAEQWGARDRLVRQYAWAIPNHHAIRLLAEHSPLIEIGAGTGYWAKLIADAGGDIIAFDKHIRPDGKILPWARAERAGSEAIETWFPVRKGTERMAARHPNRTLFLCWPPYGEPMAFRALSGYLKAGGKRVAYVGEGDGGCTGDESFHNLLNTLREVACLSIPRWYGMNDYLTVHEVPA